MQLLTYLDISIIFLLFVLTNIIIIFIIFLLKHFV